MQSRPTYSCKLRSLRSTPSVKILQTELRSILFIAMILTMLVSARSGPNLNLPGNEIIIESCELTANPAVVCDTIEMRAVPSFAYESLALEVFDQIEIDSVGNTLCNSCLYQEVTVREASEATIDPGWKGNSDYTYLRGNSKICIEILSGSSGGNPYLC